MEASTHSPLTVYKASAGAGKTFTLAVKYMTLVIADPQCYRTILAVTFTNKATEEMKSRILSQLYGVWKLLPDSQSYTDRITRTLGITPQLASERAHTALSLIIHDYSYFRVQTIDAFFQSVLRNLARELDLSANLRVELRDKQVEQQAVDSLVDELRPGDKALDWIMRYVRQKMSADKSWNVISLIKQFGERNLFRDEYKTCAATLEEKIEDEAFMSSYTARLRAIQTASEQQVAGYAARFTATLQEHGYTTSDFKAGVPGYFQKLSDGRAYDSSLLGATVCRAMTDPAAWVKKEHATPTDPLYQLVASTLMPLLRDTEQARKPGNSARITLAHLNELRLLGSIKRKVDELTRESGSFLLSDTQGLLAALTDDSDSPFIFEKTGGRLRHIMIDEFQDTSTPQWANFRRLMAECMSHEGSENMVVGDVKQSIYRWRSGDWRLLSGIERQFPHARDTMRVVPLADNYRSQQRIVSWNNAFFTLAAEAESQGLVKEGVDPEDARQITDAYADVCQHCKKAETHGYVRVTVMPTRAEYDERIYPLLTETIDSLLAMGAKQSQIAILVRTNVTIQQIAAHYMAERPDLRLVSAEAFRLDSSPAVARLVDALRALARPDDEIGRAALRRQGVDVDSQRETLLALPLYDLAERLASLMRLDSEPGQAAYLHGFFDQMLRWMADHTPLLDDFLQEWDDTIHDTCLDSSEADGIRLITIHQSKGLEFDHVIMPACHWILEKSSTLWCGARVSPYRELPLVPIAYGASLRNSVYEQDYYAEHLQLTMDNLNMLYVAFTRAAQSLHVFACHGENRSDLIRTLLPALAKELGATLTRESVEGGKKTLTLQYGVAENIPDPKKATANVFLTKATPLPLSAEPYPKAKVSTFRQSRQSLDFMRGDDERATARDYVRMGDVLHRVFSTIRTAADIPAALALLDTEGITLWRPNELASLRETLRRRLEQPRVGEWFRDGLTLLNECDLLYVDPATRRVETRRPDRVICDGCSYTVVDFKFASPTPDDVRQVRQYVSLLTHMGHTPVRGYLWYVYSNRIIEV